MFNIMKKTTIATFAALTLVSVVAAPAFAQQSNFNQQNQVVRQDNNNDQLVGGAIGAVVGGLIGSEVAGRGNGTEGAIVGALVGGVAGAAIADSGNDRRFNNSRSFSSRGFNRGFNNFSQFGYYDKFGRFVYYDTSLAAAALASSEQAALSEAEALAADALSVEAPLVESLLVRNLSNPDAGSKTTRIRRFRGLPVRGPFFIPLRPS